MCRISQIRCSRRSTVGRSGMWSFVFVGVRESVRVIGHLVSCTRTAVRPACFFSQRRASTCRNVFNIADVFCWQVS